MTAPSLTIHDEAFYRAHGVELVLGVGVRRLAVSSRYVELEDGRTIDFEKMLVATGAAPRVPAIPGVDLDGVLTLRTSGDALRLKAALDHAGSVVVLGGGLVGLEVTAVARAMGRAVTVVEATPRPLARLLHGHAIAETVTELHRAHGTIVRTGATVTALRGRSRVEEVVLSTGERIAADVVLVAVGIAPATAFLRGSGVDVDDGVLTDAGLETNVPGIFAAGDVARAFQPALGRHVRFEQYGSAHEQGRVAGRRLAGANDVPRILPGAGSQQFGVRMTVVGDTADAEEVVVRGSLRDRTFVGFFVRENQVRGAFVMNRPRDLPAVRKLIGSGTRADPGALADEAVPLGAPGP